MATATAATAAASVCSHSSVVSNSSFRRRSSPNRRQNYSSRNSHTSSKHSPTHLSLFKNTNPNISPRTHPSPTISNNHPLCHVPSLSNGHSSSLRAASESLEPFTENSSGSTRSPLTEFRRCFCGIYSENLGNTEQKPGRCKFCRCKAKYIPGQRSFDTSRLFGSHKKDTSEKYSGFRRAVSEDRQPSRSSRFFSRPLVRQERLTSETSDNYSRDHGLRTPPAPPPHETSVIHSSTPPLIRSHTDPSSSYERHRITSPPPSYDDAVKQHRQAPPSYEEALSRRLTNVRARNGIRSVSEERTLSTSGSLRQRRTPLTRTRAEEIPDIYWEQAARELDFCTCRKCQARYRQYFEEYPDEIHGDGIIPMETQMLMQEVLTDGIAFCSLM